MDSVQFTRQLLENGDDVEVMSMSQQAEHTLEHLAKGTWEKDKMKPTSSIFLGNPKIKHGIETYGTILKSDNIVIEELPEEVFVEDKCTFKLKMLGEDIPECDIGDLNLSLKATYNNEEIPVKIESTTANTQVLSCIPNKEGELTLTVNSSTTELQKHTISVIPYPIIEMALQPEYYDEQPEFYHEVIVPNPVIYFNDDDL